MDRTLKKTDSHVVFKLIAIYVIFSCLWICLSDTFLPVLISNQDIITRLSVYKGIFFIIITCIIFYHVVGRKLLESTHLKVEINNRNLLFNLLSEGMIDAYVCIDMSGKILQFNDVFRTMLGYDEEELLTKTYIDLSPKQWHSMGRSIIEEQIIPRGYSDLYEKEYQRKDGTVFPVELRTQLILDDDGTPHYMWAIIRDITDRKQVEMYGEMGRKVLQILNDPGSLQDAIQRILIEVKTRTGVDAIGIRLQDGEDFPYFAKEGFSENLVPPGTALVNCAAKEGLCRDKDGKVFPECMCGQVISGMTDPANPNLTPGGSFWTNDSASLLSTSHDKDSLMQLRTRCINEDYTSFALVPIRDKEGIVGLIQLNGNRKGCFTPHTIELLEGTASHIGQAVVRKRIEEELQKKNKEIEQFLYCVSHELRSPVVTVKTFMGYLEQDLTEDNRERVSQDLQFINGAADKMQQLLDELLELARLDHVQADPVKVTLKEVLTDTLDVLAGDISKRKADITLPDMDLTLYGEYPRLCQIWQNLIGNAIKYSHQDSTPRIELGVQQENGEIVFSVKDNGIGIDPQHHNRIFGIFEKLNPDTPGVGLGLPMTQRIIEKCAGGVWVESEGIDKGSCFYFTLPSVLAQS